MLERKDIKFDKNYTIVTYEITQQNKSMSEGGTVLSEDVIFKINNFSGKVEVDMRITNLKADNPEAAKAKLIDWLERLAQGLKEENLSRITI